MYDFDTLLQRKRTDSTKWDALERDFGQEDLLPFWVADADYPVLPAINQALCQRAEQGNTFGYTFAGSAYFQSVIHWNRTRHNLALERQDILTIPGVVTALAVLITTLSQPGDRVLINPPVYPPFSSVVTELGRQLVQSPLHQEQGRYLLDFEDLARQMAQGVSLYILCSPHNPVGRVWTREELERVSALCRQYGVVLISDEIHYDILLDGHVHTPILNVDSDAIMITAPSKTFNIAGLKSSTLLIKNAALRQRVRRYLDAMHLYVNLFAYRATETAYTQGAEWVDEMNTYLLGNARMALDFLAQNMPRVVAYLPESTYLMWLDFSAYGLSGHQLQRKLVEEAHLALNPGDEYGEAYGAFARLNIATPRDYLMQGLCRLADVFRSGATVST